MNTELQIEQPLIAGHELGCKCFQCGQEWLKANYEKSNTLERNVLFCDSVDLSVPYIKNESQEDYLKRYDEMLRQRLIETLQFMIRRIENAPHDITDPYSPINVDKLILYLDRSNLNYKYSVHLVKTEAI